MISNVSIADDERLDAINENLSLIQLKGGLTFGTDAYLLSAFTRVHQNAVAADLGGGTGVASLLCLSRRKFAKMYAFELQERFCDLITRNADLNGLSDKLIGIRKDVRKVGVADVGGIWLDAVISNPPYMKVNSGFNSMRGEMNIARRELNGSIYDFCACAARLLKHGGSFYTVYRPDRMADLFDALHANGLEPKKLVLVYPNIDAAPCLLLCESRKGGASSLILSRPLIIYQNGTKNYTEDFSQIYDTCSMEFLWKN